ncbi:MAG: hypothetical protein ABFD08_17060 [Syntrophomonas sp.]
MKIGDARRQMYRKPVWVLAFPEFPGIKGLVPVQEIGVEGRLINRFVGQGTKVLVKSLDRNNNLAVCSRRELVEKAGIELLAQLNVGDIIPVTIKAIMVDDTRKSSLVVDGGGGLLLEILRSQAVKRLATTLRKQYTVGQTVDARIMGLDPITVSIWAACADPWEKADYKRGQFISGTIYRVNDGLVFIEPDLSPGLLGVAPFPFMGEVSRGSRVCKVRNFSAEQQKLSLLMINQLK